MLQIVIPVVIVAAILLALQPDRKGRLITHTPYNNRNSDAAGAREDHLD